MGLSAQQCFLILKGLQTNMILNSQKHPTGLTTGAGIYTISTCVESL